MNGRVNEMNCYLVSFLITVSLWSIVWEASAHRACENAPSKKHRITCERLMSWNQMTLPVEKQRKKEGNLVAKGRLAAGRREPTELGDCMDIHCVATFLIGNKDIKPPYLYKGKEIKKVIRKEVRQMKEREWKRLISAIQAMKDSGLYDEIALIHMTVTEASNAHSGPAFFPWHREYIKRFELELRRIDPDLYVPYWDSTLESALPNPSDSIIWSDELFGTGFGGVTTGPWRDWITDNDTKIQRSVGENGDPFTERELIQFWEYTDINMVLAQTGGPQLMERGCMMDVNWEWFELIHGNAHNWIGGDMLTTLYATRDPPFFMHHSFVDLIWEKWRLKQQNRTQRETAYPADKKCMTTLHWPTAVLIPFNKRNIDGLSNAYTDNLYEFGSRPTCSREKTNCDSKYLFCDLTSNTPRNKSMDSRCSAKARLGGVCKGYKFNEDVCYEGRCVNGRCALIHIVSSGNSNDVEKK